VGYPTQRLIQIEINKIEDPQTKLALSLLKEYIEMLTGKWADIIKYNNAIHADGEKCPNCVDGHFYKTIDHCKCGYERRR